MNASLFNRLPGSMQWASDKATAHPTDKLHCGATYRLARVMATGIYVLVDLAGVVRTVDQQWAKEHGAPRRCRTQLEL